MLRIAAAAMLAGALLVTSTRAQAADQVVFLVRHAERAEAPAVQTPSRGMMADDPPLSPAGQDRARRLAALLASSDVKHIFTTEFQRTRQTAAPLAERMNVKPVMAAANDPDPLIAQIRKVSGNVLVVGHANTLPDLLKRLGVKQAVTIGDNEFDNLFVVVRHGTGEPTLIRLRY
jgi:broad specificity phosphatase PhoE